MIRRRRGAILLEVMLAIGLFAGAGAFCLGVTKSLFSALERTDRRRLAIDLARSKMAELEAGLITVQDLRDEWSGGVGSRPDDVELAATGSGPSWEIDAVTIWIARGSGKLLYRPLSCRGEALSWKG